MEKLTIAELRSCIARQEWFELYTKAPPDLDDYVQEHITSPLVRHRWDECKSMDRAIKNEERTLSTPVNVVDGADMKVWTLFAREELNIPRKYSSVDLMNYLGCRLIQDLIVPQIEKERVQGYILKKVDKRLAWVHSKKKENPAPQYSQRTIRHDRLRELVNRFFRTRNKGNVKGIIYEFFTNRASSIDGGYYAKEPAYFKTNVMIARRYALETLLTLGTKE